MRNIKYSQVTDADRACLSVRGERYLRRVIAGSFWSLSLLKSCIENLNEHRAQKGEDMSDRAGTLPAIFSSISCVLHNTYQNKY